jgi:hypothetical protein
MARMCLALPRAFGACRSVWDDYEADTELIGRGAFARVFRAIRREDQQPVAIKVIGRDTKAFSQQRRGEQRHTAGAAGTEQQLDWPILLLSRLVVAVWRHCTRSCLPQVISVPDTVNAFAQMWCSSCM